MHLANTKEIEMTHFIKALIVVSTFFGMTNLALAEPAKKTACEKVESLAAAIMKNRQVGTKLSTMLNSSINELVTSMIIEAYEQPRWSTKEQQERTVVDFANKLMLRCVKQGLDKNG